MSTPNDEGNNLQQNPLKQMPIKYKFRDIKTHSSDEWMANATKKYRKVYDRYETSHMRSFLFTINFLMKMNGCRTPEMFPH